jgi:hypothetical protein
MAQKRGSEHNSAQKYALGRFAQATVSKENKTGVKVSWQVTGVRHDAFAEKNPIQVEQEKPPRDRGYHLHRRLKGKWACRLTNSPNNEVRSLATRAAALCCGSSL